MKLDDPGTWPKHEDLVYRKRSPRDQIAHAFYRGHETLCGSMNLADPAVPEEGRDRLCMHCHRELHRLGYAQEGGGKR